MQSNPNTAMARSFSCGYNIELCQATLDDVEDYAPVGQTVDFGTINTEVCVNSCSGAPVGSGGAGYFYGWSSENSNVAPISGPNSNASANVYGASVGSTYIDSWAADDYCLVRIPSQPITVQQPDHVAVILDNSGNLGKCTPPQVNVIVRQMKMQVVDSGNNPMSSNVYIQEAFNPPSPTNSCPSSGSPVPSSCALTGNNNLGTGVFLDTMAVNGSFCLPTSWPNCGATFTSTWSACSSSGSNALWVSPRTTDSTYITVDGKQSPANSWSPGTQCTTSGC